MYMERPAAFAGLPGAVATHKALALTATSRGGTEALHAVAGRTTIESQYRLLPDQLSP
jgi:hypothetical protein